MRRGDFARRSVRARERSPKLRILRPVSTHSAALDVLAVRRLALARAGLLSSKWSGLSTTARGASPSARGAAHDVIGRFGYLQLDTISVAGARSHALVLLSRLDGMDAALGEKLLVPGAPLFEYWGHAACWMPLALYPLFEFRRVRFRRHPWWGELLAERRAAADEMLRRTRDEGPFRSVDLEGERRGDWWGGKDSKRVAEALWSAGELAIRERRGFQRVYDLTERVIPAELRGRPAATPDAFRALILLSLDGHGWADAGTIAATFNLRKTRPDFVAALRTLVDEGAVVPCDLTGGDERRAGWIRPRDLDAAERLRRIRPRDDAGVLLTPFDPLLWDRARVRRLFGFDVVLEIYVPAAKRRFGYFCMPVLAGERLIARVDVKADRAAGRVRVQALHYETPGRPSAADREAVRVALERHARAVGLAPPR
jgi:uncharacterized protein YcaQ